MSKSTLTAAYLIGAGASLIWLLRSVLQLWQAYRALGWADPVEHVVQQAKAESSAVTVAAVEKAARELVATVGVASSEK
jgi:hypothetical protein